MLISVCVLECIISNTIYDVLIVLYYSNQFYVFDARSGEKEQSVSLPAAASGGFGYEESGRAKEIRIPKAKIKGVAETRADQKVRQK